MSLISAMNPTAPITTEAEAQAAARSSAIAIVLGVIYGVVGIIITYATMASLKAAATAAAAAQGAPGGPDAALVANVAVQSALWMGVAFTVIQAILAIVQWRRPNKVIAIIFLALIALGVAGLLFSLVMSSSGSLPATSPATPIWQVILGLVVMVVEAILHVAGLRGISKLEKLQLDAANSAY
jgi:hypothetical protein